MIKQDEGSHEHRFVTFEIQAIRDAWHSEISPILLAMKLFPLQVKRIKITPLLKIHFVCLKYNAYASFLIVQVNRHIRC